MIDSQSCVRLKLDLEKIHLEFMKNFAGYQHEIEGEIRSALDELLTVENLRNEIKKQVNSELQREIRLISAKLAKKQVEEIHKKYLREK